MTLLSLIAPLALAAQSAAPAEEAASVTLEALELEQAAALRCAVAFALVSAWQQDGDERGAAFPALEEAEAREFFVRTMARLMDERALDRAGVLDLVALQNGRFELRPETVGEIMPACLLMKRSAGL
ncbi:hypothetical protein [Erythrobacter sp.]|uniref:hypothetical protein n=1 Tax=Erythrobacter sp. TaxID=1042 RepID=UPI001425F7EF|nr:hypothetical protein [Erythrobacter sp.]QIQ87096.1 MAG: hypothetical protein G9473_10665 [Erythrobacter sp.]